MADDTNEIPISITLDDGSVRQGFARIKQSGEDTGQSIANAFSDVKRQLLELFGAYEIFQIGRRFIEESISAASQYETALNNVSKAMSSAGTYTDAARDQFISLAENIENTTTVSETHALQLEALARNYTTTNEQAQKLTKASVDLAAATGKDATAALQQLGQTLSGAQGRIGQLVPQVRSLTEYQLRMGDAIDIVAQRFAGAAAGDVNTFDGTLARLQNAFEQLQISIGRLITNSPTIRAVLQFITKEIASVVEVLKGLSGNDDFMHQLVLDAITVGKALNDNLVYPFELFYNISKVVFDEVGATMADFGGKLAFLASKILGFFSPKSELAKGLGDFAAGAHETMKGLDQDASDAFADIGNSKWTNAISSELDKMKTAVDNAKPFSGLKQQAQDGQQDLLRMSGAIESVGMAWTNFAAGARGELSILVADSVKKTQQIGAAFIQGLGNGVGQAFAMMGKAMAQGKNLFEAFGQAMLAAFGQALIQLGSGYIAIGLARVLYSYGADATGWGLISQGGALAALGGAMSAIGSSASAGAGASAGASSAPSAAGDTSSGATALSPTDATQTAQKAQVQVHIHGDVFDSKDTGLRIVELVNQAFTTSGAKVLVGQ